jgi:hypothetical protein
MTKKTLIEIMGDVEISVTHEEWSPSFIEWVENRGELFDGKTTDTTDDSTDKED